MSRSPALVDVATTKKRAEHAELSARTMEVLKTLDSRCFGFLGFHTAPKKKQQQLNGKKDLCDTTFVSKELIRRGIQKLTKELSQFVQDTFECAGIFCHLGHLHLLLEEYPQAMSAFQKYQTMLPTASASNENFLYGLGLIYFHMNSYKWAKDLFQKVLELVPSFARSSEIYLRLGVIFKKNGDYCNSMENFKKALTIPGPSSFNKLEIQYHIGHLHYLQGYHHIAKKTFEGILSSKAVPNDVKAKALRQLGWLFHTVQEISNSTPSPHAKAIELLTLAVGADSSSPQAWYFLGRCHAHERRYREAFLAYQYAISQSSEEQADIWCSIGLLYHKMNQPRDSLQSYLCAVYLEPHNVAGWINLGCLYEAAAQPLDALLSYKNAISAAEGKNSLKYPSKCLDFVHAREYHLEQFVMVLCPSVHNQPHSLPNLYQAWHNLIPSNIRSKSTPSSLPILQLPNSCPTLPSSSLYPMMSLPLSIPVGRPLIPPAKRTRISKNKDPIIIRNISDGWNRQSFQPPLEPLTFYPSPSISSSPSLTPTAMTPEMEIGNVEMSCRQVFMPSPCGVSNMDSSFSTDSNLMMGATSCDDNRSRLVSSCNSDRMGDWSGSGYDPNVGKVNHSSSSYFNCDNPSSLIPTHSVLGGFRPNSSSPSFPPPKGPPTSYHHSYTYNHQEQQHMPSSLLLESTIPQDTSSELHPPPSHHYHMPASMHLHTSPLSNHSPLQTPSPGLQKIPVEARDASLLHTVDRSYSAFETKGTLSPPLSHPHNHHGTKGGDGMNTCRNGKTTPTVVVGHGISLCTDSPSPYQPPSDNSVFDSLITRSSISGAFLNKAHPMQCVTLTPNDVDLPPDLSFVDPLKVNAETEIEHVNQYLDRYLSEDHTQENPRVTSGEQEEEREGKRVLSGLTSPHVGCSEMLSSDYQSAYFDRLSDTGTTVITGKTSVSPSTVEQLLSPPPPTPQAPSSSSEHAAPPHYRPLSSSFQSTKLRLLKCQLSACVGSQGEAAMIVQPPLDPELSDPVVDAELLQAAELLVEVSPNVYLRSPQGKEEVASHQDQVTSEVREMQGAELWKEKSTNVNSLGQEEVHQNSVNPERSEPSNEEQVEAAKMLVVGVVSELCSPVGKPMRTCSSPNWLCSELKAENAVDEVETAELLMVAKEVVVADETGSFEHKLLSPEYVDQMCSSHNTSADVCGAAEDEYGYWMEEEEEESSTVPSQPQSEIHASTVMDLGHPSSPSSSLNLQVTRIPPSLASSLSPMPYPFSEGVKTTSKCLATRSGSNLSTQPGCNLDLSTQLGSNLISKRATIFSDSEPRLLEESNSGGTTGDSKEALLLTSVLRDGEPLSLEEVSDSGISSTGTKPSTVCSSSGDNSPQETTSPTCSITEAAPPLHQTTTKNESVNPLTLPFTKSKLNLTETLTGSDLLHFNYPSSPRLEMMASSTERTPPKDLLESIQEPFPSLACPAEYMVLSPYLSPPKAPQPPKEGLELHPKVDIYQVKDKDDAFSTTMHTFCCNPDRPICLIRGLCSALELDINLFSSASLTDTCPDQFIEVRDQIQQGADENFDSSGRRQVWKCESSRSYTTIREYSHYQAKVQLAQDDSIQSDCSDCLSSDGLGSLRKSRPPKNPRKMIRFGTNVDLSDKTKWRIQLQELHKLPNFLRVASPEADFLSHIGHTILGMNSVQLYMKVSGSRTPGHQENNNFCSININIGPGDCEWFAVHNQYWGVFHQLCEKHKLSFLTGSWWPVLSELEEMKVPVYWFTQHMEDVVWLNPGTVHWVQANNVCNNIAWNVGPLTAHQFRMSWERYQWNKIQKVRSIVPMVHLSWNLVQTVKINNKTLYQQLRSLLDSSLKQNRLLLEHLDKAAIPVHWHGREPGEPAPSCKNCLDEVFNILFVLHHRGEYLVYCYKCATALKKSFTVLQQFDMKELRCILSSFQLHSSFSSCSPPGSSVSMSNSYV